MGSLRRGLRWGPLLACGLLLTAAPAWAGTTSFTAPGEHQFVVPPAVTALHLVAAGGRGGGAAGGVGVAGAKATADLAVAPGELLYAEVAGNGGNGGTSPGDGAGGSGGGGAGGTEASGMHAGGGGGASDVRTSPASVPLTTNDTRLVVAGGGGGSGFVGTTPVSGGPGGGTNGSVGGGAPTCGGGGGTQSGGGTTFGPDDGVQGSLGNGGSGGGSLFGAGGGGGGGYYGGGGGASEQSCLSVGGGGGGSGRFAAGMSNASFDVDSTGVPSVTFTYVSPPSISIVAPAGGASFTLHEVVASSYSCRAGAGTTLQSCVGPIATGVAIDTSTVGQHTFIVIATDADGGTATASASYVVKPAVGGPTPKLTHVSVSTSPRGTGETFGFTLNTPARVTFVFAHRVSGRKVGGRCVVPTGTNRRRPKCARSATVLHLAVSGHAGPNRFGLAPRRLKPGRYTVTVSAVDAHGRVSTRASLTFTATS